MAKKMVNQEHIEGYLYQHDLTVRTVQNQSSANYGKEFINGSIDIATDEEALNVLNIHFSYVTEMTKAGTKNRTYTVLQQIINENKTWLKVGKDEAMKLKVDTSLDLNDFYNQSGELVSAKRNEGGFVNIVSNLCDEAQRNTFTLDMYINGVNLVDVNEEKGITQPYVAIKGAVFNFRNDLLPVELFVKSEAGMKYFEDQDITNANPMFTKVWGKIVSGTSYTDSVEESAFGESIVKKYEHKTKEWIVTGTSKIPYDFGDVTVLTADDVKVGMQNRQVHLAEIKQRNDEYQASKAQPVDNNFNTGAMNVPNTPFSGINVGDFDF